MAGLTRICNVQGYYVSDGERVPVPGRLIYRGIDLLDLVHGCEAEDRFGYEEVAWLLLFGTLPTQAQLTAFTQTLAQCRELPEDFIEDMIMKAPSPDIMNKLARCVLASIPMTSSRMISPLKMFCGNPSSSLPSFQPL